MTVSVLKGCPVALQPWDGEGWAKGDPSLAFALSSEGNHRRKRKWPHIWMCPSGLHTWLCSSAGHTWVCSSADVSCPGDESTSQVTYWRGSCTCVRVQEGKRQRQWGSPGPAPACPTTDFRAVSAGKNPHRGRPQEIPKVAAATLHMVLPQILIGKAKRHYNQTIR